MPDSYALIKRHITEAKENHCFVDVYALAKQVVEKFPHRISDDIALEISEQVVKFGGAAIWRKEH